MTAMQSRQIQKNSYQATGNLKAAKELAAVMAQEVIIPAQEPEKRIEPTVIFSQGNLGFRSAVALA
jgi:hypothetical protein